MKKLLIIIISIFFFTNIFADEIKLPEGFVFDEEKSFVEKILDKFTGPKKLTKAKTDTFSLTCEGEFVQKTYVENSLYDTRKEIFFEDFDITIASYKKGKEITKIKMTNSSHQLGRDVYYEKISFGDFKKNLRTSKDNMQISLLSLNRNDETWIFDESPARISLKSGVYSGKINGTVDKDDMNMTSRSEFRSKCACGSEIIKFISSDRSSYLDYWWAVILIIAITFFIFTQSGKRLKKIRRK